MGSGEGWSWLVRGQGWGPGFVPGLPPPPPPPRLPTPQPCCWCAACASRPACLPGGPAEVPAHFVVRMLWLCVTAPFFLLHRRAPHSGAPPTREAIPSSHPASIGNEILRPVKAHMHVTANKCDAFASKPFSPRFLATPCFPVKPDRRSLTD